MAVALKPLDEQVMVITGASSGIGLATARAAAKAGARVVLAARNAEALTEIVAEIEAAGGQALAAPCDVGDAAQVDAVAQAALDRFGRIDTWVNNAGVVIWGRTLDIPEADARRLFETNFWGVVHGSRAAVRAMRKRGGALVNVGSIASDRAVGLQGMYSASKHAVKGFTDALRMEFVADEVPISVTLIKPASIATPIVKQSRNYLDREPTLPPPLYKPEDVAAAILYAAARPVRALIVGSAGLVLTWGSALAPSLFERIGGRLIDAAQEKDEPARPRRDNLYEAGPEGGVQEVDDGHLAHPSVTLRAALHPAAASLLVAGGLGALLALTGRRRR